MLLPQWKHVIAREANRWHSQHDCFILLQHILRVKLQFLCGIAVFGKPEKKKNSSDLPSLRLAWWESKLDLRVLKLAWEDLRSSRAVPANGMPLRYERSTFCRPSKMRSPHGVARQAEKSHPAKSRSYPAIRKSPWHNLAQKFDQTLGYGSRISSCLYSLSNLLKSACFDQAALGIAG